MLQATEWTAVELAGGQGDLMHIFGSFNAPVLRLGDGTVVHVPGDPVSSFPAWCIAMQRPDLAADERFTTRESRHANRAAMLELFQEFAATFSRFDDFEAGARSGALGGGGDAPARRRRWRAVGAGAPGAGRRGRRAERAAASPAFAVPLLGRVGGHDRDAGVAGAAQPRGAHRGARPLRRRRSTGSSATACSSTGRRARRAAPDGSGETAPHVGLGDLAHRVARELGHECESRRDLGRRELFLAPRA